MKNNRIPLITCLSFLALSFSINARENVGINGIIPSPNSPTRSVLANCSPATAHIDIDINNVRATLQNGGDMWWDLLGAAQYEIPKGSKIKSLFAGSLWIGGYDAGNQLKVAAMTYRQTGNDYWPGPLNSTGTTDASTCLTYDRFWKINKSDVEAYNAWVLGGMPGGVSPIGSSATQTILEWPTMSPDGTPLAPYYDADHNGVYSPELGDYPDFDLTTNGSRACTAKLKGDQAIWWIFNDKGNIHTETGGASIGLEIQAQAFGFATNDEINDMTFYNYIITNKSSFALNKTHFGVWVDADLGGYNDDYVGCDVSNGFGYSYNSDAVDEGLSGVLGYGSNPPAIGIDFFEGPYADSNHVADPADSTINGIGYGDSTVDNERLGMERFIYYNNDQNPINGNPGNATDFYNYLTGKWRNNSPMVYGGNAVGTGVPCKFVFPDDSDPKGYGTNLQPQAPWSEWRESNPHIDRRFMQVAGPFTLRAGAVNVITTGAVWARATQGGPMASLALLKGADQKAQKLFNNCFKTLDGPTAPDLTIQELNNELILTWNNPMSSNNYLEGYSEDPDLAVGGDSLYRFQGYQIYQLLDPTVSPTELNNVDRARLVLQCDKKDGIKQIVNYTFDQTITANVPQEMVNGSDLGIVHSTSVKTDLFATGDNKLVNHKTYYYTIVAYGFSSTQQFNPGLFSFNDFKPYLAGRKNVAVYSAIPHIIAPELGGTEQHSEYGSGIKVTRIEGQGNGGNVLDITSKTVSDILSSPEHRTLYPEYENGHGPVTIKVVDPLNVPNEKFRLYIKDTTDIKEKTTNPPIYPSENVITPKARWVLVKLPGGNSADTVYSNASIAIPYEQILNGQNNGVTSVVPKWGISVNIVFSHDPADSLGVNNGSLSSECTLTFADVTKRWLTGLPDQDGTFDQNWIRSGTTTDVAAPEYDDYKGYDDNQDYEKIIGGTWAPYRLTAKTKQPAAGSPIVCRGGPQWDGQLGINFAPLKNLASVDVVFTSDKSKWTRCPVLELQEEPALAIGGAKKLSLRKSPSVDKEGRHAGEAGYNATEGGTSGLDTNGVPYPTPTGMGWFPGYAINLETGERLNMAFGEDSYLTAENGADMLWNPTSNVYSENFDPIFGGKHYIYVFGHNFSKTSQSVYPASDTKLPKQLRDLPGYDGGVTQYKLLQASETAGTANLSKIYKGDVYFDAMWVNIPLLNPGHTLLETDAKVRLRVTKAYDKYATGNQVPPNGLTPGKYYFVETGPIRYNGKTYQTGSGFTADSVNLTYSNITPSPVVGEAFNYSVRSTINDANGLYEFNTADVETHTHDDVTAKEALDLINIVPNPYYAYSGYEKTSLDNIVKITNIPAKCTISIYTLNGNLVRRFKRDETGSGAGAKTSLDWDLKNEARIPVASGLYIIHVDVPEVGEKILKWFGVMRPIDLESY